MLKITDPAYYLPVVEALQVGKLLSSGRTKPTIVRGVCSRTGVKADYVVKFKSSEHLWQGSNLNELLGSFIAMELDFIVPPPAIIHVSQVFADTMEGHENFVLASKSTGYNFGCELKDGYQELVLGQPISEKLLLDFQDLFAFDVLIGNPDRRLKRPNFLTNGKDL